MSVRDDLIRVAVGEIGVRETGVNKQKYGEWYGYNGVAWCAIFVSWCAAQCGLLGSTISKTASCDSQKTHFTSKGKYFKSAGYGGTYSPKAGDLIFFSDGHTQSDSTHIGIVTSVSGGKVNHVSGNWGDAVGTGSNNLTDLYVIGYGCIDDSAASGDYSDYAGGKDSSGVTYGTLTTGTSKSTGKIASTQTITKKHTEEVSVSTPYAKVEVYTESAKLSINQTLTISEKNLDKDILAITTSRDMSQDCPTFSIVLSYQREWYEKIASNDLLIIKMCRPPEKDGIVFFGLVDDVRKSESFQGNKPTRKLTITGRGFSKALARFEIGTLSEVNMMASSYGFLNQATIDGIGGKPPATVINTLLEFCLGLGCDYNFSNGKKFTNYLNKEFSGSSTDDKLTDVTSITSYSGSLWNLMKELKDAPFNEMFWEVHDDKPTLIFRSTPFEEADWTKLPRLTIKDSEIISMDIGVSDTETYVVYKVIAETFSGDSEDLILPLWYEPYYKKYGLSRLEVSSLYLGTNINQTAIKTEKLFNWNILNNSMENGSITVKGKNSYKVGTRVILESTGIEYYVEAVEHTFTFFEGWNTTLSLTRGLNPSKRYSAPWGKAAQIKPEDAVNIFGYSVEAGQYNNSNSDNTDYGSDPLYTGGAANQTTTADEKTIWNFLMGKIGNAYGVAGLMGNLFAESGLVANNLQNSYNASFGMSDSAYTSAVDSGSRSEYTFVHDSAGYGLAQWTYYTRKQKMYTFAKSKGTSIGNLNMQLEFLWSELSSDYPGTLSALKSATSVYGASTYVLTNFEKPKNQGASVKNARASYGQTYYNRYA